MEQCGIGKSSAGELQIKLPRRARAEGPVHYRSSRGEGVFKRVHINLGDIHMSIKPGPKPIADSTGKTDQRRRVTPENKPKHPDLKEHDHKKGK